MLNDVGDVVLPKQVVTPDGRVFNMKRNDLMDHDRPQNMKMDGDKDGGGNENPVNTGKRTGSAAYKSVDVNDKEHFFSNLVDNYVNYAEKFTLKGGDGIIRDLYQIEGSLRGEAGIFEWIVEGTNVTHRRFIKKGTITGTPNQRAK